MFKLKVNEKFMNCQLFLLLSCLVPDVSLQYPLIHLANQIWSYFTRRLLLVNIGHF